MVKFDGFARNIGAGYDAGVIFGDNMQNALNSRAFSIEVTQNTLPVRRTVFGYADGALQAAGDAGPEAVVGVTSMQTMIDNAVRAAMPVMAAPRDTSPRMLNLTLECDRQAFARLVYDLNNQESQRVGVQLVR